MQKRVLSTLSTTTIMKMLRCCVLLPRMSRYLKFFHESETMYFMVENEKLLKRYNEICSEINKIMKRKKNDSDPIFDNKYLRQNLTTKNKNTSFKNVKNIRAKPSKEELSTFVC